MQRFKDNTLKSLMYGSIIITLLILLLIIGFVIKNGASKIDLDFISQKSNNDSYYVTFKANQYYQFAYEIREEANHTVVMIKAVDEDVKVSANDGQQIKLQPGMYIDNINKQSFNNLDHQTIATMVDGLNHPTTDEYVKVTIKQDGIRQLILTTLIAVLVSLAISIPLGLFCAIYLHEYKISKRFNRIIHFAIDSLAAIPSIVFGLFGFIFFCITLKLGISILSATLTVSIMLLPTVIKTIEEALMSVPNDLREASYGLGASKSQTIFKIIIPAALPGILLAVILAIGRIIGESAIFIFTAGTTAGNPTLFGPGVTLTVDAYEVVREYNDIQTACGIGIIILVIVLALNILTKYISKKYQ